MQKFIQKKESHTILVEAGCRNNIIWNFKCSVILLGLSSVSLEDRFLFCVSAAFSVTWMETKAANRYVPLGVVRELEMSRDWFRCVFTLKFHMSRDRMSAEALTKTAPT